MDPICALGTTGDSEGSTCKACVSMAVLPKPSMDGHAVVSFILLNLFLALLTVPYSIPFVT
jgi:hypothetical protein